MLISFLLLTFLLASCEQTTTVELTGKSMGTSYAIQLAGPSSEHDPQTLQRRVDDELETIEQSMSTYREDSELSRFNAQHSLDWFMVSPPLAELVARAQEISTLSQGALDITAGPLVDLWGFGPGQSKSKLPTPEQLERARLRVGFQQLQSRLSPPALRKMRTDVSVDLSAIAKGYAVDRIAELLNARGLDNYLIEFGGEIRARGSKATGKAWRVGIEQPRSQNRTAHRVIELHDFAIATSGNERNYFQVDQTRYGHIIDPRSGKPASHDLASVTVLAKDCATADAWATALAVAGTTAGLKIANEHGIQAYFIQAQAAGLVSAGSQGFEARFGGQ